MNISNAEKQSDQIVDQITGGVKVPEGFVLVRKN
jgi:hypothetical protein